MLRRAELVYTCIHVRDVEMENRLSYIHVHVNYVCIFVQSQSVMYIGVGSVEMH